MVTTQISSAFPPTNPFHFTPELNFSPSFFFSSFPHFFLLLNFKAQFLSIFLLLFLYRFSSPFIPNLNFPLSIFFSSSFSPPHCTIYFISLFNFHLPTHPFTPELHSKSPLSTQTPKSTLGKLITPQKTPQYLSTHPLHSLPFTPLLNTSSSTSFPPSLHCRHHPRSLHGPSVSPLRCHIHHLNQNLNNSLSVILPSTLYCYLNSSKCSLPLLPSFNHPPPPLFPSPFCVPSSPSLSCLQWAEVCLGV